MTAPLTESTPLATSTSAGPELVQLLTPEGERVTHPDYDVDLTDAEYRDLYRDLVLVRRIDVEATALQRQGELGIWAALLGQEAAQVGSGRALRTQDFAFPTYREHGVAWCKGVDPLKLLGLFRGASNGGWDPQEKRFNLYTIVIGSQTLHATGYAMGINKDGAVAATRTGTRRRSRTSATAPAARATSTRRSSGRPPTTRPWCSSARTTSGASAPRPPRRPASRSTSAPAASASPASGSTATTSSPPTPSPARRSTTPAAARARRWSRPSPTAWARTRRRTTPPATGSPPTSRRGSSRTRSSG